MTSLEEVTWLNATQREILSKFHIRSLESLASFELRDSFADAIPIDGFRSLAKRARQELGRSNPLAQIGQAAGHRGPVKYAGGVKFGGHDGGN